MRETTPSGELVLLYACAIEESKKALLGLKAVVLGLERGLVR
jgi:hypothetical protein